MRGSKSLVIVVRILIGNIEIDLKDNVFIIKKYLILNIFFFRGFFVFIEFMKVGMELLNYLVLFLEDEVEEFLKFEKWFDKKLGKRVNDVIMGVIMFVLFIFVIGFFVLLFIGIVLFFKGINIFNVVLNLIEVCIRIVIFLLYMFLISKMKDIYRVF